MNLITKLRRLSKSSLGFTIPQKIIQKFNLKQGEYKTEVNEENGKIVIILENIWRD